MKLVGLPKDVLVAVLSKLGPQEIGAPMEVSKALSAAAKDESLWEIFAVRRFGVKVSQATRSLYGSYREMVMDDNQRGALPTLHGLWKSQWHYNSTNRFYCCLIVCIKWHRPSNQLWLYLDARGESDLRRPETSGVWLRELGTNRTVQLEDRVRPNPDGSFQMGDIMGIPRNVRPYEFLPDPSSGRNPRSDRLKGILKIDANLFSRPGSYQFCFANAAPRLERDYQECTLFTLGTNETLMDAFDSFSLEADSPFARDTETAWKERWAPHLPGAVVHSNTTNRLGPWPECIGMNGKEAAAYIRSQNPDLRVNVCAHDQAMSLYFCSGEVRFYVNRQGIVETAPERG